MLKIEQKITLKLVLFGDGGVGKTTLIRKFVTKVFEKDIKMTIGTDFSVKNITLENKTITLRIWDFAGEDRFRVLLPAFAKGADGGIFMFDLTRYSSIKNIEDWLSIFEYFVSEKIIKIPLIIVGGKSDLEENRSVNVEEVSKLSNKYNFKGYFECSSKTGKGVEEVFHFIAQKMVEKKK